MGKGGRQQLRPRLRRPFGVHRMGPDGEDRLVFHSWYGGITYRAMNTVALQWEAADGVVRPVVGDPENG